MPRVIQHGHGAASNAHGYQTYKSRARFRIHDFPFSSFSGSFLWSRLELYGEEEELEFIIPIKLHDMTIIKVLEKLFEK